MQLHHSKKVSLYKLSRELEKVAQLSILIGNPVERQALAQETWQTSLQFADSPKKPTPDMFGKFLRLFTGQPRDTRMKICPVSYGQSTTNQVYNHGSALLGKAGVDIQSLDQSVRENVLDFICAVDTYHREIYAKPRSGRPVLFSEVLANKKTQIQEALLSFDLETSIDSFAHELMESYIPDFDLDKITFGNSKNYGNVIYGDPNACEVLKTLQSTLKFDLKSLGIDTANYHQSEDISELKRKNAGTILSKQGLIQKVASSLRRKSQDLQTDSSGPHNGPG